MKAIDLIIRLQQLPPNMEVMFDATNDGSEMFKLVSVDECEEIETESREKFILLSCEVDKQSPSQN